MKRFGPLLAVLFVSAFASLPAQQPRVSRSVAEQYLFQAANAERAQRGLNPLRWDDALYRAAIGHAIEMARRESISHQYAGEAELTVRGQEAGARFSVIAENVAEAPSAVRIHEAWMSSPHHRENLLDPRLDSIAISVIRRNGQLYAVQDFERAVANLSFSDQEMAVASLLTQNASLQVVPDSVEARRTCEMETGYAGQRRPWFVMRYTSGDLTQLPETLRTKLGSGKFHEVAVGACAAHEQQAFSSYNIAVLLYP